MTKQAKEEQSAMANSSPPSPSHEFSFTLHPHPSSTVPNKAMSSNSFVADLSPADDIFFHGHLLPLHFLSHFPITPRSSTDSSESFSSPLRPGEPEDRKANHSSGSNCGKKGRNDETKGRIKGKSFTLFWSGKWRKGDEVGEREKEEDKKKLMMKFKVGCALKNYLRTLRPLFLFRSRKKNGQPYTFSSNSSLEEMQQRGGATELSVPASLRASPSNRPPLINTTFLNSSTKDSTMEELQSAIQAAIAHCKNSIAKKDEELQISQD